MDNFWHKKDKKFNKNVSVRDLLLGKKNFFREIYFQSCGYSKRNSLETYLGSKDRSKPAAERTAEYKEYLTKHLFILQFSWTNFLSLSLSADWK